MTINRIEKTPIMHRVVEHGEVLYLGGLTATDASASMKGQTEQVLAKLEDLLRAAGSDRSKVLSAAIYLTDMKGKSAMNDAWTAFFGDDLPARATLGVSALGSSDLLIEIVVIASH